MNVKIREIMLIERKRKNDGGVSRENPADTKRFCEWLTANGVSDYEDS